MRRFAALATALSLFSAACDGDSEPTPAPEADTTAPEADTTAPEADTTAPACEKECFFNADCAEDQRCAETEGQLYGCCEVGARGTGATTTACTSGADCVSGVCVEMRCTVACESDATCPAELPKCNAFAGICIPGDGT